MLFAALKFAISCLYVRNIVFVQSLMKTSKAARWSISFSFVHRFVEALRYISNLWKSFSKEKTELALQVKYLLSYYLFLTLYCVDEQKEIRKIFHSIWLRLERFVLRNSWVLFCEQQYDVDCWMMVCRLCDPARVWFRSKFDFIN